MVHVKPFAVEQWMDIYQPKAKYDLAETCVSSISLDGLMQLSTAARPPGTFPLVGSRKLGYGAIRGSNELRSYLSKAYHEQDSSSTVVADQILITPGAIQANFLVLYSLVGHGDHVICVYPTYQQLYSVPESVGAEVSLWRLRADHDFSLDLDELASLIRPNTKMIILNNPNNPTGAILARSVQQRVVDVAAAHDLIILSDEVYRPLFHSIAATDPEYPPSILSLGYARTIATGSMSKVHALAGIRVGWIASQDPALLEGLQQARDYSTISVSQLDDQIAAFALSPEVQPRLHERNTTLARQNLDILARFVAECEACSWVKPVAGTTAFVQFATEGQPVDDEKFCKALYHATGVMFCPGKRCFGNDVDFRGYVRIGYACETETLRQGLDQVKEFLRTSL
ncbi:MAG: hypothetical protein M1838_000321 [Thelocarpon superellum]|nr:MAG: hypothetical protein M1838_000321 [Thelocarpon superellum]